MRGERFRGAVLPAATTGLLILHGVVALADPGTTTRVSVSSGGVEGNNSSRVGSPSISDDGRYAAFLSFASNLVPGDTNNAADAFVHDLLTGTTTRVSVASGGLEGNGETVAAVISGDGRFVAFSSTADNLVPGDSGALTDVFLHDRLTGQTTMVSVSSSGQQGNGHSGAMPEVMSRAISISDDGRYVAFNSDAGLDGTGMGGVFVHDRLSGETIRVSFAPGGNPIVGVQPAISGDGRYVAFCGDRDPAREFGLLFRDLQAGTTESVALFECNTFEHGPSISDDGRYIAFATGSECQLFDLPDPDCDDHVDVYVKDRVTGVTAQLNLSTPMLDGDVTGPAISGDGRYIAFTVEGNVAPLVTEDTNGAGDVFVHDRQTGAIERVSISSFGEQAGGLSEAPTINGNGRYVPFVSFGVLAGLDTNETPDVFVRDRAAGAGDEVVTGEVPASGGLTTDSGGDGASSSDPVETWVGSPNAGRVSIEETPLGQAPPGGFQFLGQQVKIEAPSASAATPLTIRFRLDASVVPPGQDPNTIQVFKDQAFVPACAGTGVASPDPCVGNRELFEGGDVELTVLTSSASVWNFGPSIYAFTGFFSPVDNPPTLNLVNAGRAIPVKFSLGGNFGLNIFAAGYPKSRGTDCDTSAPLDPVEETVTAGSSSLTYDLGLGQYIYAWKTSKPWAGTCRQLAVKLADGNAFRANCKFK